MFTSLLDVLLDSKIDNSSCYLPRKVMKEILWKLYPGVWKMKMVGNSPSKFTKGISCLTKVICVIGRRRKSSARCLPWLQPDSWRCPKATLLQYCRYVNWMGGLQDGLAKLAGSLGSKQFSICVCGWSFFVVCFLWWWTVRNPWRVPVGATVVYNLPICDLNGGTEDRMHYQQAWGRGTVKVRESGQWKGKASSEAHQESREMNSQKPHKVQQQLRPAWERKSPMRQYRVRVG